MKRFFDTDSVENITAFITGDFLATIVAFSLIKDVAMPMLLATLTGFLGGLFAILGKVVAKKILKKYE
jgi:hypothetical protein